MGELAYINGTFCDLGNATVSIEDRGYQFGDGVYEVVVAFGDKIFQMNEHLDRLRRSMTSIGMTVDPDELGIEKAVTEGVRRCGFSETMAYVQVTRGVQSRSHDYRVDLRPTVVMTFKPRPPIAAEKRTNGVHITTIDDFRWSRCDIKSISLLANIMAKNQAIRDGYDDAVFVGPDGEIREATSANIFAVRDGRLVTPSVDEPILHGITRGYVLECAARADVPCVEQRLTVEALVSADEAFLSSTTIDILAVTRINNKLVDEGKPGPITQRLYHAFVESLACA